MNFSGLMCCLKLSLLKYLNVIVPPAASIASTADLEARDTSICTGGNCVVGFN